MALQIRIEINVISFYQNHSFLKTSKHLWELQSNGAISDKEHGRTELSGVVLPSCLTFSEMLQRIKKNYLGCQSLSFHKRGGCKRFLSLHHKAVWNSNLLLEYLVVARHYANGLCTCFLSLLWQHDKIAFQMRELSVQIPQSKPVHEFEFKSCSLWLQWYFGSSTLKT
jgi:hypothetical protein